jgi:hypothetical protein
MSPSPTPAAALLALVRVTPVQPASVARLLDDMSHADRVAAVRALGRPEQRRLYEAVAGFARLTLADLVPPRVPDAVAVRHHGRNTLPAFTRFEKRFARPRGQDAAKPDELWGYNFQPTPVLGLLTGPGYFLAVEDRQHAEVLIDYTRVPAAGAGALPAGWPPLRSNEAGLARFVYGFMIDTLRRVSEHVTIGSAARRGRDLGSWFVLCREDPPRS